MKRVLLTGLAWLLATLTTALVVGGGVLFVAGPHAGRLPQPLAGLVLVAGWLIILGLPIRLAWGVWRRQDKE